MSGLFGGGGGGSPIAKRLTTIAVQSSAYGETIPLVYGTTRVAATLLWFGDFAAIRHEQDAGGKGGGGSITTYTYQAACILGICEGQISGIDLVWVDKDQKSLADAGFTLFDGTGGQATWSYLTTNHPAEAIPYDHTAYIAHPTLDLGSGASVPNYNFLVHTPSAFSPLIADALPSVVLADYLGDAEHGAQFPYLGDLTAWATYCQAMGLFISPAEVTQRQAADFLRELMEITNSGCRWSAGELQVLPFGDAAVTGHLVTFTPDLTPEYSFTDDDYLYDAGEDPVRLIRKGQSERFNRVRVEFLDSAHDYNTAVAEAIDDADIAINGERPMTTIQRHAITDLATARLVAQLILQRQLYVVNTYQLKVRADYSLLDPLDLVDITDASLGLSSQLVRILSITDEDDDSLTIEAEEVPVGVHSAPRYSYEAAQGYAANYGVAPGSVQAPLIFAAPPYLVDTAGGAEIWVAVNGANAAWGGATVWASFDDVEYRQVGVVTAPARYGVTQDAMTAGSDPDTTNTITVQLNRTTQTLASATQADVDGMRSLAYLGGEIVGYRDAALVGPGQYDLSYFRRGLYRTAAASHASGVAFARLDDAIFAMPFDPGMAGATVYLKFTSFNIYGGAEQDLSAATAYSFVLPYDNDLIDSTSTGWLVSGTCSAVGQSIFKLTGSNAEDSAATSRETKGVTSILSFRCSTPGKEAYIGFSTTVAGTSSATLDYAWHLTTTAGTAEIKELGSVRTATVPTFTKETVFSIATDGVTVRYLVDGVVVYASPSNGRPMNAKAVMVSVGGQLNTVKLEGGAGRSPTGANLLNIDAWRVGASGTVGPFTDTALAAPMSRIVLSGASHSIGPYGQTEAMWLTAGTAATENGGWINVNDLTGIDPTKTYRSAVWVYWDTAGSGNPTFRHGCDTTNTSDLSGAHVANPYFTNATASVLGLTPAKWYLSVGVIHGAGYSGSSTGVAGIYDPATGTRIIAGTEFKFRDAAWPWQTQRVSQYGTNDALTYMLFCKPRFEAVTGNEPSIATLLSPRGALAYKDTAGTVDIDENAATEVYTSTVAGPTDVFSATGTLSTVTSISVPSFAFDTDQILIFTGSVDHHLVASQADSMIDIYDGTYYWGSATIARNVSTSDPDIRSSFVLETIRNVAASTAVTYQFRGVGGGFPRTGPQAGSYVELNDVYCKVIVVKR